MHKLAGASAWRILRVTSLIVIAVISTAAFVRFAPGYFSESQELDAQHASLVRAQIGERQKQEASFTASIFGTLRRWAKGDLGTSRHFDVPVAGLLRDRSGATALLLSKSLAFGWLLSFAVAFPLSAKRRRRGEGIITLTSAALLCVPIGLLATVCLVLDVGGPVLVLGSLIAIRDFKILYRMLANGMRSSAVLYARAQGFSAARAMRTHLYLALRGEFLALGMASLVVALSALVPVEVVFDRPGLGQLAWSAAMNRDLPALLPVTVLMAALIGLASLASESDASREVSACA